MEDRRLYYEHPEIVEHATAVTEAGVFEGRPYVRLAETPFHPEGGGQPADRGTISGVAVVGLDEDEAGVRHFLAAPLPAGPVVAQVDAARRLDLRQQHTAQHLLTAVLNARHERFTTSFHLGEAYTAIEVTGPVPPPETLAAWEEEVNAAIREDRPVRTRWADLADLERLNVRTRGLPDDFRGRVRLVEIEGIDRNTCGGTHVHRLAEIQVIHLLGAEPARGGTRLPFVAGGRVLARLRVHEAREDALKSRLGQAPEGFAAVVDGWVEEKKAAEKRVRRLLGELAERIAAEMAKETAPVLRRIVPLAAPELLREVANRVLAARPSAVVELVGADAEAGTACFLVLSGPEGPPDVAAAGARLRDALGAKGGGRGRSFMGAGGKPPATWPP